MKKIGTRTEEVYRRFVDPLVSFFRNDIDVDVELLTTPPLERIVFLIRNTGTTAINLPDPGTYPPEGARVPFLFGRADRDALLKSNMETFEACVGPSLLPTVAILYADDEFIHEIDEGEAFGILEDYASATRLAWRVDEATRRNI